MPSRRHPTSDRARARPERSATAAEPANPPASPSRERRGRPIIARRPRAGLATGLALSALFALLITPVVMLDAWAAGGVELVAGEPAPITVRIPQFAGAKVGTVELSGGPIAIARGQLLDSRTAAAGEALRGQAPTGWPTWLAYFVVLFVVALLYTSNLRRTHDGVLLRTQAVTLALIGILAVIVKIALTLTTISTLVVPVAAIGLLAALVVDLSTGLATALVASLVIGLTAPFDLGMISVLAAQSVTSVMVLGELPRSRAMTLLAGALGGVAAAAAYLVFYVLASGQLPLAELDDPLRSAWLAAAFAGLLSALITIPARPVFQYLLGEITHSKLIDLADLSNPLLVQIAKRAPGTWQHTLAMANMAEIAANAIGANARLTRTGAYFHDLGKSLQPKYFIENLESGEESPHEDLPPRVSADAIFAHVTEGVRLGREAGLPERIIDFMHMHHGDGLLEYFWSKCQGRGNPEGLQQEDFRYPGVKPQSKETAILAICDAVEAASRTLRSSDDQAIASLVQRIVYGKLHLGQLDESGLSMAELRMISNSLIDTVKHATHGRIEYPWQRAEREASQSETAESVSVTQRIIQEPRLDSLDAPRAYWRGRARSGARGAQRPPAPQQPTAEEHPAEEPPADLEVAAQAEDGHHAAKAPDREVLAAWEQALEKAATIEPLAPPITEPEPRTGPPAPSPRRAPPTIELMASADGSAGGEPGESAALARASSESDALSPGMMVVGPPPATQPEGRRSKAPVSEELKAPAEPARSPTDRDPTVVRQVVVPAEAHRDVTVPRGRMPSDTIADKRGDGS